MKSKESNFLFNFYPLLIENKIKLRKKMIKEIFIYTYFISLVLYWLFFWIPACEQYNERERTAFSSFFRSKTFREYVKLGIIVSALPILNIILAFITVGDVFACIDKGR